MATRRALRLLLVLSTKKQNCFCQLLSDTRQRTHRYTDNHIQKRVELTQLMKGSFCYTAPLLRKQPRTKRCSLFGVWLLYEPRVAPPLLVTWGAQVQLQFILECLLCICIWDARAYVLLFYCNFGLKKIRIFCWFCWMYTCVHMYWHLFQNHLLFLCDSWVYEYVNTSCLS